MGQIYKKFSFKTKPAPQTEGAGGANWEHVPLADIPPSLSLSFSTESFASGLSNAMANMTNSFRGLTTTLNSMTQNLQTAACSLDGITDNLIKAQNAALNFANSNNKTKIYVKVIGTENSSITSKRDFMNEVRYSMLDQMGSGVGSVPKIVPAEVPLDATAIAAALSSGDSAIEQILESSEGISLGSLPVELIIGEGLGKLSNDEEIKSGFSISNFASRIVSIVKEGTSSVVQIFIEDTPPIDPNNLIGKNLQISGSSNNDGSYPITGYSDGLASQSYFTVKVESPSLVSSGSGGRIFIDIGNQSISLRSLLQSIFVSRGLLAPNKSRTIPVSDLVDILIEEGIVGTNPELLNEDKGIATERLVRLTGEVGKRVGGLIFVGQAPDVSTLAKKIKIMSYYIEYLKPLAKRLENQAKIAQLQGNAGQGVDYTDEEASPSLLNPEQNVGVKDAQAVCDKIEKSKIFGIDIPDLESLRQLEQQPEDTDFNSWRHYTPIDLIPGLSVLGKKPKQDSVVNQRVTAAQQTIGDKLGAAYGYLGDKVEEGKNLLQAGCNEMTNSIKAIEGVVNKMNTLNKSITEISNFLNKQVTMGPVKLDAHLIGAELDLLSNLDFVDQVELAINDQTDPNRPTFGPPAASSIYDNQINLQAAIQGGAPISRSNRLWFGMLIFVVGSSRKELGEQLEVISRQLNVDTDPIAINKPNVTKLF